MSRLYIFSAILSCLLSSAMAIPTMLAERKEYVAVALTYFIDEPNRAPYEEPSPAEVRSDLLAFPAFISLYTSS